MYRKVYKICEIINKAYEALALLLLVAMTIALALQVFWLAVLVLLGKLLMRRAEKKITVQGG